MTHPLEGVTRIINVSVVSAGAGATNVNLRPAAGRLWEVLFAVGTQDDGAVTCQWLMTDPDTAAGTVGGIAASAAWKVCHLGSYTENANEGAMMGPVVLTYDRYLIWQFVASAGAKNGYIRAIVKEYRGVALEV